MRAAPETSALPRRPDERPRRDPLAALGAFLQQKGLKHSRQRQAIAQIFFDMGGHVPVDALVARVREQDPRVSVATVYRTMKLLAECGLAVPRRFGEGQTRYEPADHHHGDAHDHLICTACGAIVEFESERITALQRRLARRHGFEVERRRVELYGRCAGCRGAAAKEPA
ncbi:Fur family transcriptional regulator [Anaeromyxobacter diazotrophicus]|uniref:Ferric uptake regulation protein n=1 Tax=Anaeromyxobacter diazotrophicus TaxID=2590199 RepID=A0A7I9VLF3_9BACT|nr:transcriptional repressor [Anaeromyxobacter diazotrophicus]GEJ57246.1 transcriptional repressor [Anaeromyxobacter diazotrophicus]